MPLASISEQVFDNLPFLDSTDVPTTELVDRETIKVFYMVANALGKTVDIEDESTYSEKEIIMIAYYVSFLLVQRRVTEATEGNATTGSAPGGKAVKKAVADVTEVEFTYGSNSGRVVLKASELLAELKRNLCACAMDLGISLSICNDSTVYDPGTAFIFITDC